MPLKATDNQPDSSPQTPPRQDAFILLSRYNLIESMTEEFLKPSELYTFNDSDPGQMAPRHLLLFLQPVSHASFQEKWGETPENFPVLVRVTVPAGRPLWRITADYNAVLDTKAEENDIAVLLPFGLSTQEIQSVCFRTADEREDFIHTGFENVKPGRVKAELFTQTQAVEVDSRRLKEAIRQVSPRQRIDLAYRSASSLAGGLLAGEICSRMGTESDSLQWALALLSPVQKPADQPAFQKKYAAKLVPKPDQDRLSGLGILARQAAGGDPLHTIAEQRPGVLPMSPTPEEDILFRIITVSLIRSQPDTNLNEFVEEVTDQFVTLTSTAGRNGGDTAKIQKALGLIGSILNAENSLPETLSRWPATLAGLLLFALRPRPEETLTWRPEQEDLQFTDTSLLHAMLFSGLRSGIGPFPTTLRDTPNFAWIKAMKLAFLETFTPQCYETPQVPRFALKVAIPKASRMLRIELVRDAGIVPGALLILHPVIASPEVIPSSSQPSVLPHTVQGPGPALPPEQTTFQIDKTPQEEAPQGDTVAGGEPVAAGEHRESSVASEEKLIERLRHSEETDAELERMALQICRHLEWENCIRRSYILREAEFYMKNTDQGLMLELVGSVPSEEQIIWKRFRRHIDESEPEEFKQAVRVACGP